MDNHSSDNSSSDNGVAPSPSVTTSQPENLQPESMSHVQESPLPVSTVSGQLIPEPKTETPAPEPTSSVSDSSTQSSTTAEFPSETPVSTTSPVPPPPITPTSPSAPSGAPPSHSPAHGPNPALILSIIMLVVLGIAAAGYSYYMQMPKDQPEPTDVSTIPTIQPPTETPMPEATDSSALLESMETPTNSAEFEAEIDLLDQSMVDGAERKFEDSTIEEVQQ